MKKANVWTSKLLWCQYSGRLRRQKGRCPWTHGRELVGRGSVVQQQVDDVGVSLLRRLVKGRVVALHKTQPRSARRLLSHKYTPATQRPAYGRYLGLGVDLGLTLQQEVDHLHVAIVTGHMEGAVSQLKEDFQEWSAKK